MSDRIRPPVLLVIDDEPAVAPIVERFARPLGFKTEYRANAHEALALLDVIKPDVALVDLQMPELSGIDVLHAIRQIDADCQVILMTGNATVDTAIQAVKGGALDYLSKPFDFTRLEKLLLSVRERLQRRERLLEADVDVAHRVEFHGIIGRAPEMQQLFATIERLAPHARTVLVTGETGTGKELVAKALHHAGRRREKRFLTVNCSAVVETLFESELFGHVRGAFTGATETKVGLFEHANGGTLFLDEAGELPLSLQPKLLRAVENGDIQRVGSLDTRKADVTVIAATNRDLRAEVEASRFRADLFHRLSILELWIPPLRDRRADIPILTAAFVEEFATRLRRPMAGLTAGAERLLHEAHWPGNVRELRNVIERACIMQEGRLLTERDIAAAMRHGPAATSLTPPPAPRASSTLSAAQREQIVKVLQEANGNKVAAAKLLGVSRRSLYRWLDRLGIDG